MGRGLRILILVDGELTYTLDIEVIQLTNSPTPPTVCRQPRKTLAASIQVNAHNSIKTGIILPEVYSRLREVMAG